jgi:hypothetical protein
MDEIELRRAVADAYKRLRAAISAYSTALQHYHDAVQKRYTGKRRDHGRLKARSLYGQRLGRKGPSSRKRRPRKRG